MNRTCLNCSAVVQDTYCSHCGQMTTPERITFRHILSEIIHFFTHLEKGFVFTTKKMITSPGKLLQDFLIGNRRNYQPPVSYFLIWNALFMISIVLVNRIIGEGKAIDFGNYFGEGASTRLALTHLNIVLAMVLPIQALVLFLILTGKYINYWESLVVFLYGLGTVLFGQFVFLLMGIIYYLISGTALHIAWSDIFKAMIMSWMIFDFTRQLRVRSRIIRSVSFLVVSLGVFTVWRIFLFPVISKWIF